MVVDRGGGRGGCGGGVVMVWLCLRKSAGAIYIHLRVCKELAEMG
jgi:hypothetical protein